jgi:hypothetical protein
MLAELALRRWRGAQPWHLALLDLAISAPIALVLAPATVAGIWWTLAAVRVLALPLPILLRRAAAD